MQFVRLAIFFLNKRLTHPCPRIASPLHYPTFGVVVQLVRTPACHAGGREFKSRPSRHFSKARKFNDLRVFFVVRPAGRTCLTVIIMRTDESLLSTRQGEGLAEGQLRHREVTVGRKPMAKHWPDEQESHKRRSRWMRRQLSLKSDTCTESVSVYAAGISVKAGAHYPGRSPILPLATGIARYREGMGEVSRGHSSRNRSAVKGRTGRRR